MVCTTCRGTYKVSITAIMSIFNALNECNSSKNCHIVLKLLFKQGKHIKIKCKKKNSCSIDAQKWNFWKTPVEPIPVVCKLTVFFQRFIFAMILGFLNHWAWKKIVFCR